MNYSPVQHHHTQSREFKSARLSQRGIWITLLQYCTSQENNGIIKNFASWKPAEIRKTLNVDPATLRKKSTLWNMVGEDLHIYGYPHDKQAILNKKQNAAAIQAYQQTITCGERYWQLLKAYYNGYYKRGQTRDSHNNKYYCPASRLKFYEDIIDVLTKAELWAKDTRWKPKISPANAPPPQRNLAIPPPQETDVPVTPEELKQFFDEINPH